MAIETKDSVKQVILSSGFPEALKDRLVSALPLLYDQSLSGLEHEVSRADSLLIAEKLTILWESFSKILSGLRKHEVSAKGDFFKLFADTRASLNEDDQIRFLSLAADVRRLAENKTVIFSEQEMEDLINFEVSLLRHLSPSEIGFFLEHYALSTLGKINLVKEIQVAAADQDWSAQSEAFKNFSDSLLRNQEIVVPGTRKSVAMWLREFINFNEVPLSKKSSLHSAEFIVKQPTLRPDEKIHLSNILSLFLWCQKPSINFDELSSYRQEVETQKLRYYEILYEASQNGNEAVAPKYWWQVPAPKIPTAAPYYRAERITVPAPRQSGISPNPPHGLTPKELMSEVRPQSVVSRQESVDSKKNQIPPVPSPKPATSYQLPATKKVLPPPPRPPVQKSEVRSQISIPSSSPPYQGGETMGTKPAPQPPPSSSRTPSQSAEQLYKSTLEELQKMREEEKDLAQRAKSFSVNTAVARAGQESEDGQVVAGPEDQVEKKLSELEEKLEEEE